jgi:tRNA (Thr-GGU) A37 N-methylase
MGTSGKSPQVTARNRVRPNSKLRPVGVIRSALKQRSNAPKQGAEGAPDAWLDVRSWAAKALNGLAVGDEIIVITWLHRGRRDVLGTPVVDIKPALK